MQVCFTYDTVYPKDPIGPLLNYSDDGPGFVSF